MSGIMSQSKLTLWYSRCIVLVMDYSICWTVLWIVEISLQETLINDSRVEKLSHYFWTCLQHENASVLCCKHISFEISCEEDYVFLHKNIELCLTESNSILFFTNLSACANPSWREKVSCPCFLWGIVLTYTNLLSCIVVICTMCYWFEEMMAFIWISWNCWLPFYADKLNWNGPWTMFHLLQKFEGNARRFWHGCVWKICAIYKWASGGSGAGIPWMSQTKLYTPPAAHQGLSYPCQHWAQADQSLVSKSKVCVAYLIMI